MVSKNTCLGIRVRVNYLRDSFSGITVTTVLFQVNDSQKKLRVTSALILTGLPIRLNEYIAMATKIKQAVAFLILISITGDKTVFANK